MAYDEKELVYNLYPLQVGWQELPVLTLEYNTKADPQKNDSQNALLDELVQRALPKRVFVLVSGGEVEEIGTKMYRLYYIVYCRLYYIIYCSLLSFVNTNCNIYYTISYIILYSV